jgi:hypothetical protein
MSPISNLPKYNVRITVPNIVATSIEGAIDIALGIIAAFGVETLPVEVVDANTGKVLKREEE